MRKDNRIWVAGSTGMLGSAIARRLAALGQTNVATRYRIQPHYYDLTRSDQVSLIFSEANPEYVFLCAARVGGIKANIQNQSNFLYDNTLIQLNVIQACADYGVKKLVNFASSCIYPRNCQQPMSEDMLLTGPFEPTNEGYAMAKMLGLKFCEHLRDKLDSVTFIPPNLYGPNDNFDLETGHFCAAIMRRLHEAKLSSAKSVKLWGTGMPVRQLAYVDDVAEIAVNAMVSDVHGPVNIGGPWAPIVTWAQRIAAVVGYEGRILFDGREEIDGMPVKVTAAPEWIEEYESRLEKTYQWFVEHYE